jgi:hypothetical protein
MHNESIKCLLARLEQLNAEASMNMPTEGFWEKLLGVPEYTQVTPILPSELAKTKLFIEDATEDQMADIEATKQKIDLCITELEPMQKGAFAAQKEKMKICYDFFGKYEGTYQSSDWARRFWFDLHDVDPDRQKTHIPENWVKKMRFGRPDAGKQYRGVDAKQQKENQEESRKDMRQYAKLKKEWETYVDSQWDAAFDDAFGVKQFQAFLGTIHMKIGSNLQTTLATEIDKAWTDLHEETKYFHQKISTDHVRCEGLRFDQLKDDYSKENEYNEQIRQWKERPPVVQEFYDKVQDLVDEVEILLKLRRVDWCPTTVVDLHGNETAKYVRNDPIKRKQIYRDGKPVYCIPRK